MYPHGRAGEAATAARLGNYRTRSANYDYAAIWGVVSCLAREAEGAERRFLFVVSDGQPCTPLGQINSGVEATRQAVADVRKLGWKVIGIGIDGQHCSEIYGQAWTINIPAQQLSLELARQLKKLVRQG